MRVPLRAMPIRGDGRRGPEGAGEARGGSGQLRLRCSWVVAVWVCAVAAGSAWVGLSAVAAHGANPTQKQETVSLSARLADVTRPFSQNGVAKCEQMLVAVVTVPPGVGGVTVTMTETPPGGQAHQVTIPGLALLDTIGTSTKTSHTITYGDLSYTVHGDDQAYGLGYGGGPGKCDPSPFSNIKATGVKVEATLVGKVSDDCGNGVAGVDISARSTAVSGSATTGKNGSYVLPLTPDIYNVRASGSGAPIDPRVVQVDAPGVANFTEHSCGQLSLVDVARGTSTVTAAVRVKLDDRSADASGCDPKATYTFSDPDLQSTKTAGPCRFDLEFRQPGTGIYHVALHATAQGKVIPLSVDQYGDKVDGHFTVIIDSCSRPANDVPDVDSLLDPQDATCDVMVGNWDDDSASLAREVVSEVEGSRGLALAPVSVDTADPDDWLGAGKGLSVTGAGKGLEISNTGWIPTGTNLPPRTEKKQSGSLSTANGDAIALVDQLVISGLPETWDGAGTHPDAKHLNDRAPATVISAHGAWFTPDGLVRVPVGDVITTYVPIGSQMGNDLGTDIDTGNLHGLDTKYMHVYKAGDLIPNFLFVHYEAITGAHVINPPTPTTLNALLKPNQGQVWISTCEELFVPKGETLEDALSDLVINVPGTNTFEGETHASITAQGDLHT